MYWGDLPQPALGAHPQQGAGEAAGQGLVYLANHRSQQHDGRLLPLLRQVARGYASGSLGDVLVPTAAAIDVAEAGGAVAVHDPAVDARQELLQGEIGGGGEDRHPQTQVAGQEGGVGGRASQLPGLTVAAGHQVLDDVTDDQEIGRHAGLAAASGGAG